MPLHKIPGYSLGKNYKKIQNLESRFARFFQSVNREGTTIKMSDRKYIVEGGSFRRAN